MSDNRFYIEEHVRRMVERPTPHYRTAQEIRERTGRELVGRVHLSEVVPLPPALLAERHRLQRKILFLNGIFFLLWFLFAIWAFSYMVQDSLFSQPWAFWWRALTASLLAFLHYVSASVQAEVSLHPFEQKEAAFRQECSRVIDEIAKEQN